MSNRQRLNVSLTRAKYALFIICNKKSLKVNDDWNSCIQDAQDRKIIVDVDKRDDSSTFKFAQHLLKN